MPSIYFKQRTTKKIENIVNSAVEQMPKDATNIRLIEGFRHSVGAFGTHSNWTEVEAVYKDDDGKEVGRVRTIDKVGGWIYSDPANYILYKLGLYKPINERDLYVIRERYADDLNNKHIFPIHEVYSNEYLMDLKVKELIFTEVEVDLTFKKDYDVDAWGVPDWKIVLNDFETSVLGEFDAFLLFKQTFNDLTYYGIKVNVKWDMTDEDKRHLRSWRWENIPF